MDQNLDDEDEDVESFAYADYSGVVVMIQTYYYKMLELFRKYYAMRLKGKDYKVLKQEIQTYIFTVVELLQNYEPIKSEPRFKKTFEQINKFAGTLQTLSFDKMRECIKLIVEAHYKLGLSKLEFKKHKREDHIEKYRKDLG